MLFGFLFLAFLFVPTVLVACMPSPWWRPIVGWLVLGGGLLWLDERNIPWEDKGIFGGIGEGLLLWVFTPLLVAAFVKAFRDHGVEARRIPFWADWHAPVSILFAVFFFHWLANRLAGASPSHHVHLMVALVAAGVAAVVILVLRRWPGDLPRLRGPLIFAACTAVAIVILVGKAALTAHEEKVAAGLQAGGRPWCVLTFAGNGRARPATHWLELSPLVSRSGGRSYVEDVAWLAVQEEQGVKRYRYRKGSRGRYLRAIPSTGISDRVAAGNCQPQPGGNLG